MQTNQTQQKAQSNKRPSSLTNTQTQPQKHAVQSHTSALNSPGLRHVKHPSHTQMLNAIGANPGPINQKNMMIAAQQVVTTLNKRVDPNTGKPVQMQHSKTPSSLKAKQLKPPQGQMAQGSIHQNPDINATNAKRSNSNNPRKSAGRRIMANSGTGNSNQDSNPSNSNQAMETGNLKKFSQHLYKHTEQWLNHNISQVTQNQNSNGNEIINEGKQPASAMALMNDFLKDNNINAAQ